MYGRERPHFAYTVLLYTHYISLSYNDMKTMINLISTIKVSQLRPNHWITVTACQWAIFDAKSGVNG